MNSENRKNKIQNMIAERLADNDTKNCLFQIILLKEESKDVLEDLFKRNGYETYTVDTVDGCWNLNDDWYELDNVKSIVEFCGVYPVEWNINDVFLLEELYYNRDIYIQVFWKKKTKMERLNIFQIINKKTSFHAKLRKETIC